MTLRENIAVAVPHVIKNYATPAWVYDTSVIRKRLSELTSLFDVVRYAQKACSNINILKIIKECGAVVDSVSLGELQRSMHVGFNQKNGAAGVVYTADIFDRETLGYVIANNIEVNVGSIDMLDQIGSVSSGHRIWLRVNPGFGHGHSKKTNTGGENSKHGIWFSEINLALELVQKYELHLVGFHMHIGSGVDYEHLSMVCDAMVETVLNANCDIEAISAGGGLSIAYRPEDPSVDLKHYFTLWDSARKKIESHLGHSIRLEIEPGRYIVAESGVLISEVRSIKKMGSKKFVLVDAGFNDLMRPALYGSYHSVSAVSKQDFKVINGPLSNVSIAGPLCESGDVFTQDAGGEVTTVSLPEITVGDYILFHNAGAYGASMSSNYNSRPLIPEIMTDGREFKEIRKRQSIHDLIELEMCN